MWCVVLVGEGEVEVAGRVERDAEGEVIRPRRRFETGAAAEGGRMEQRAAAKPPWRRAVRRHGKVVVDGGGGAHLGGDQLPAWWARGRR